MSSSIQAQIQYPATQKIPHTDQYHGTRVEDPYHWLENDTSAATGKWVKAQNKVTQAYLDAIPFREKLKKRMAEVYNYPRYSTPFRNGGWLYFYKNDGLQNQSVLFRQKGLDGAPQTVIDPNALSAEGTTQLAGVVLSRNGRYAAWGMSEGGSDWQTYLVRDMRTLKDLADTLRWVKVSEIAWQGDGFYYSRYPKPAAGQELSSKNENHQVWFHKVGTPQSQDRLVYEDENNGQRFHTVVTSENEGFVFLTISDRGKGFTGNALYFLDNQSQDKKFVPIVKEVGKFEYGLVEVTPDNKFLIETNHEAANSKVVLVDPAQPGIDHWTTIIPEKAEPLESASTAGNRLFVRYLKDVTSRVYVHDLSGKRLAEVKLPSLGTVTGFEGKRADPFVFYSFTSFTFPTHIYRYEIATGKSTLFIKPEVHFKPDDYITKQEFCTSKDGTKVPMFIVHRKGLVIDGKNPAILYGYGGFNISLTPSFTASLIPFLEQGGVYALANLRGGSEYGEKWHEAGMLLNKQNVFDDFIAAAEYLVAKKYTDSQRLAIRGGSNGGLLVGAVMNQRPGLFRVAVPEVGVMDMLRFHKFTIGWNWIAEYGSSDREQDFKNLYRYSPLHNIREGLVYPATLIVTADHDDRVVPAHSFKYAATLQEKYKGKNPVLIRIDSNSGHGASSIMKYISLATDVYSFILFNTGAEWKDQTQ